MKFPVFVSCYTLLLFATILLMSKEILGPTTGSDSKDFSIKNDLFQNAYENAVSESIKNPKPSEDASILDKLKDAINAILIADFFLIIFFLVWFVAAAALQSTYPVVLERFQDIFQPVVVPSLTVLMTGSIASGLLKKNNS